MKVVFTIVHEENRPLGVRGMSMMSNSEYSGDPLSGSLCVFSLRTVSSFCLLSLVEYMNYLVVVKMTSFVIFVTDL